MFSYAINVISDEGGRPQHVGSVINKYVLMVKFVGKVKAIPLQAWTGPEGARRLRLLDFKTVGT